MISVAVGMLVLGVAVCAAARERRVRVDGELVTECVALVLAPCLLDDAEVASRVRFEGGGVARSLYLYC